MGVRSFNGSSDYLYRDAAPVTAVPFSFAVWFRPGSNTVDQDLMSLGNSGNTSECFRLRHFGAGGNDAIQANATQFNSGANAQASPAIGGFSTSLWHHACGVWSTTTARAAFYNGGSKGTNATSKAPSGINRIALGVFRGSSNSQFYNGRLAHAALWSVALSDDEVLALARGVHPRRVRGADIAGYWPLLGLDAAEPDLAGGAYGLTASGTTAVDGGPPVEPYSRRFWGDLFEEVAAGGSDATATGSLPTVTTSAPAGTATGNALAAGAGVTSTASSLAGIATGDALASGAGITTNATPAEGTASGSGSVTATGSLPTVTTSSPVGAASGTASASGTLTTVTATAPTGTASEVTATAAVGIRRIVISGIGRTARASGRGRTIHV